MDKRNYFFKKFLFYTAAGLIAANFPIPILGMIFGIPAVLITAFTLSINDVLNKESDFGKDVFTPFTNYVLGWSLGLLIIIEVIILLIIVVLNLVGIK